MNFPAQRGPCVKQGVRATIIAKDGRIFVGTNDCENPQTVCPRAGMPTGQAVVTKKAREFIQTIEDEGIEIERFCLSNGGHNKFYVSYRGAKRIFYSAASGSDRRGILNFRGDLTKWKRQVERENPGVISAGEVITGRVSGGQVR